MPSNREVLRKVLRRRADPEKAKQLAYRTSSEKALQLAKRMKDAGKA